jgi:hypothetical protein
MSIAIDPTLRTRAMEALEDARKELQADKNLTPHVLLTQASDGFGPTVISIDGNIMNDETAKSKLAQYIRSKVDEHGYMAAIFVSDTYTSGELDFETAAKARLVQRVMRSDQVTAWRALGLPVHEAITVLLETLDSSLVVRQIYRRDSEGSVIEFGTVEEIEGKISGRMWFLSDRP